MRGKRYQEAAGRIDQAKANSLTEAILLAKSTSYGSFEGSLDLHVRLVGKKAEDKQFRTQVTLPHGGGKPQKVVVLDEEMIDEIVKTRTAPADIYLATPALMPKVAKVAKILGPQGKMPNPKSGTVLDTPQEKVKELASGNLREIRSDPTGIIHTSLGKMSWDTQKLLENGEAILKLIPRTKIGSVTVAATMGPGVRVTLS